MLIRQLELLLSPSPDFVVPANRTFQVALHISIDAPSASFRAKLRLSQPRRSPVDVTERGIVTSRSVSRSIARRRSLDSEVPGAIPSARFRRKAAKLDFFLLWFCVRFSPSLSRY